MNKIIHLNDYDFNYVEEGSGQTVILVHGSASDIRTWSAQIEAFAKEYHVVAYSRRFHWPNEKIKENQDYSMQQHVADLRALITYWSHEPVYLIGHSYGALMGIEMACSSPELIRKLVLVEPPAIRLFVSNVPKPVELLKLLFSKPRIAMSIVKLGATGLGPATKAAKQGHMEKALQLFGEAALGKKAFQKMSAARKEQALVNLTKSELTGSGFLPIPINKLRNCTIPTLLLTGELSPPVFSHLAARLEELLPLCNRNKIPRSSHIVHEDNAEDFNSAVLSFLKLKNDSRSE